MIKLSYKQMEVYDEIMHFFMNSNRSAYVFSGFAGTGKTSITVKIYNTLKSLGRNPVVLAYTGKAASVLTAKGIQAQTIHSKIYEPIIVDNKISHWIRAPTIDNDCIIVDESSMVPEDIFEDLMSYDIPILFVGDVGQLPAISKTNFNIMEAYDIHLDEIHRVAENNPLIKLSREIRETGKFRKDYGVDEIRVIKRSELKRRFFENWRPDMVICGTNNSRKMLTQVIRAAYGYSEPFAEVGERVMCLMNSYALNGLQIYNGELFTVKDVYEVNGGESPFNTYTATKDDSLGEYRFSVYDHCWSTEEQPERNSKFSQFTFGYAATCFKLQGSEYAHPLFVRENVSYFTDQRKFDYTAVTRAIDRITIAL